MPADLFLRLSSHPEQSVEWLHKSSDGVAAPTYGQGDLGEAAAAAEGCRVIVLVPANRVLMTTVHVPSRQRQHIINAIPYALEEVLAEDISHVHFAIGQRDDNGNVNVAAVSIRDMEHWLAILRVNGIDADTFIPETLALPFRENGWSMLQSDSEVWVRSGRQQGFVFDCRNARDFIPRMLDEHDPGLPESIVMYGSVDETVRAAFPPQITIEYVDPVAGPLALCAEQYDKENVLNLIQGRYSRKDQLGQLLRPWRAAGIMLMVALIVSLGLMATDYWQLSRQRDSLDSQMQQIFLETFPDARNVNLADLRSRMASEVKSLRQSSGGEDFISLLSGIAPKLSRIRSVELRHLSFRNGQMDLALTVGNLELLEKIKQALSEVAGVRVDLESATSRNDYVEARLRIRGD